MRVEMNICKYTYTCLDIYNIISVCERLGSSYTCVHIKNAK